MNCKRLVTLIYVLLAVVCAWSAEPDFVYQRIDYNINVTKDNKWIVKEDLTVKFYHGKKGIYLTLPKRFHLATDMATKGQPVRMQDHVFIRSIYDCSCTKYNFSIKEDKYGTRLWTGSADGFYGEGVEFDFNYTIEYPLDQTPGYDWIYFPLTYGDYNERIKELNYEIHFEKPLTKEAQDSLKVFFGAYGANQELDRKFMTINIDSSTVSGRFRGIEPETAIVLYTRLPKDYFEVEKEAEPVVVEAEESTNPDMARQCLHLSMVFVLFFVGLAFIRRPRRSEKTIDWYPPQDIPCAEAGIILNGKVSQTDLASIIPMFACQGYINIKKEGLNNYTLTKIKNLPAGVPEYQEKFMEMLFQEGDTIQLKKLKGTPSQIKEIKAAISRLYTGDRKIVNISWAVALIPVIAVTSLMTFCYSSYFGTFSPARMIVGLCVFVVPFLCCTFARLRMAKLHIENKGGRWLGLSARLAAMLVVMCIFCFVGGQILLPALKFIAGLYNVEDNGIVVSVMGAFENFDPETSQIAGTELMQLFIGAFAVQELAGSCVTYSRYRNSKAGQLQGLREALETADRSRLEYLTRQDSQYSYRIYPYAEILGISSVWTDKFHDVEIKKPLWLETTGDAGYIFMPFLMAQAVAILTSFAEETE